MKTILIDIDNTLIETAKLKATVESLKLLAILGAEKDVELVGFTSRPKALKLLTKWHLRKLGIKLDRLIMGKPRGDVYIGNRAVNFDCRTSRASEAARQIRQLLHG